MVLAAAVFGNAHASGSALEALKSAAPSAALKNTIALPAVAAQPAKGTKAPAADADAGYMFIIKRYPAGYTSEDMMAECYLDLQAGAVSADYEKAQYGYAITSKWKKISGDPKILPIIEMYPRSLYTYENIMAEAYLRTKAGAKNVDIVADNAYITLSADWDVIR